MTTFQDQPPQSRRALRQEQRDERSRAEEIDDSAEAQRSAPSGRRARAASPDPLVEVPPAESGSAAEETGASADSSETDAPVVSDSAVPKAFPFAEQVEATSDDEGHQGFRLRDFSPELSTSRAESQSASDWTPNGADDESVALDYQTQGAPAFGYVSPYAEPVPEPAAPEPSFDSLFADLVVPAETEPAEPADAAPADAVAADAAPADAAPADADIPVGTPIAVTEPVAPVAPVVVPPEERTLSRREWRAMRAAAEAAALAGESPEPTEARAAEAPADVLFQEPQTPEQPTPEQPAPEQQAPASIPPLVEPAAEPHSALSDAMAEFEALTRGSNDPQPVAPVAFVAPAEPVASPTPAETPRPADAAPAPVTPAAAPNAAAPAAQTPAKAPFSFLIDPNAASAAGPTTDTGSYTPPVGHWSRQAEMDDESQPFENTLSRDVGGGNAAASTNALVLPLIPQRDDFSSVLNATGEIMVTGTINLPGSVAATGRDSRHYDDPEVDHLFDAFDNEIANTDSAPVRAITAVSSHTATRGGIEPVRKQSNRMLNVLLVTASVMAVAVAGLLFAGFVFNIF